MKIKTTKRWYKTIGWKDLTKAEQAIWWKTTRKEEKRFVRYKGRMLVVEDAKSVENWPQLAKWEGIFWVRLKEAIVVRSNEEGCVQIGEFTTC